MSRSGDWDRGPERKEAEIMEEGTAAEAGEYT